MAFEVGVRVLGLGLGRQELRFQTPIGGPCRYIVHTWGPKGLLYIYIPTWGSKYILCGYIDPCLLMRITDHIRKVRLTTGHYLWSSQPTDVCRVVHF